MLDREKLTGTHQDGGKEKSTAAKSSVTAPTISLPKGGGAIRGIGEKFAANPVTGTGSMTVPIATSPGRSGFGPQLSLSYDSGSGNGPFGFGWSLSIPSITRKTDKGLPRYQDGGQGVGDSDVFILSGAEDLVPVFKKDSDGNWVHDTQGNIEFDEFERDGHWIRRYRPRMEGLFARIERWTNQATGEIHWRSISRDNITTLYGKTAESRIAEPDDSRRIFSWLMCQSYDDKGNAIIYEYAAENDKNIERTQANEQNRIRTANRYIKRIKYGNRAPNRDANWNAIDPTQLSNWMFEVVFDYGEGHYEPVDLDPAHPESEQRQFVHASASLIRPQDSPARDWPVRPDPFSSYRSGFEVRIYRRCQRVLMFHHFPELGNQPYLVRATEFKYTDFDYSQPTTIKAELTHQGSTRFASFIQAVIQSGFVRTDSPTVPESANVNSVTYLKKSLPPLEFKYSKANIQEDIRELDAASLENLPIGLDGASYQWVDLDGEGTSGILTEQADGWYYKRNLSANNQIDDNGDKRTITCFAPLEVVASKPVGGLAGSAQFLDLAGDGQVDLVQMEGPVRGFYERTEEASWAPFQPFVSWPNLNMHDPNLKFVDLTGDGHADILITESEVLTWHPSLAEEGFGPAIRLSVPVDEEHGPRLVFNDGTQSIYLADLSGDGLTDLVRIRNGEVCYWPNLGYGHFGPKVTMDNAPWFDHPDQFDHKRIRLADIDGSGTTDIFYLRGDEVQIYFNQSGNRWSDPVALPQFPPIDNIASVQALDLLGNGTACLVWSSPLSDNGQRPMRYIALMEDKPHLLVLVKNNLGAETVVHYAPSTKFYLNDKQAGQPWITRLPFPMHCVEKVTVHDKWRNTTFSTSYSYHHGYFDGPEREFRGFGRVEQVDVEAYDKFAAGNQSSSYITDDQMLYQPPVKTVTWFHTGAFLDRERILGQFAHEYFPNWFEELPGLQVLGDFKENNLPEPDLDAQNLTVEEWREALRACKGMMLRQEVYELDVDALTNNVQRPVKLFITAYHNCHIHRVQPKVGNQHAVFHVTESEAITYHYELDLTQATVRPDPRVAHTLNLKIDEYGNIQQAVSVVYPRRENHSDSTLKPDELALIQSVQSELHLAYTETRYTNDIPYEQPNLPPDQRDLDNYRLRLPCEVLTYELTGIQARDADDTQTPDVVDDRYFTLDELRAFKLSDKYQDAGIAVEEIAYQVLPNRASPQKRLIEHVRTLFFAADLENPLSLGQLNSLALPYESYTLALTDAILNLVFNAKIEQNVQNILLDRPQSGYLRGAELAARFGSNTDGQYWMCSGVAGFNTDAAQHFYLPECYTDPFGNQTTLSYDQHDLYIQSSTDVIGNRTEVTQFDFRVLAPGELKDTNDNLTQVCFDALGMPAAMAVMGKGDEGDNLDSLDESALNPDLAILTGFFVTGDYSEATAKTLLGNASARYVSYFGEIIQNGQVVWGQHPACACAIVREQHVAQQPDSPVQTAFEYSDGVGNVLVKKMQAEPEQQGGPLRWLASGKTILNNKGKPVKQYEPYFSQNQHRFEEPAEVGVTLLMYYDAVGRLIRTEMPDGTLGRIEFSPWHVTSYDPSDTVIESQWYADRGSPAPDSPRPANPEARAAWQAARHADTPSQTFLDALGREVIVVAHNRVKDPAGPYIFGGEHFHDEKHLTFTRLDAEGKPLWIRDARGNLVMQYIFPAKADNDPDNQAPAGSVPCYDIAGNLLFQHSMDAGDRWMLNDAAGKPMFGWDSRHNILHTTYDVLHRPIKLELKNDEHPDWIAVGHTRYGENAPDDKGRNLRGRPFRSYDQSGLIRNERYDFKGNVLEVKRRLATAFDRDTDWQSALGLASEQDPDALLMVETFTQINEYDALNRMTRQYSWHKGTGSRVSVRQPKYNERGLLVSEEVLINATRTETGAVNGTPTPVVKKITYNEKGQRLSITYGNDATTTYEYNPETFRLIHLKTQRLGDTKTLQDLSYTYDPSGNITEINDRAQPTVFFNNFQINATNLYTYDALSRLVEAEGREHAGQTQFNVYDNWNDCGFRKKYHPNNPMAWRNYTERYEYDSVGNILSIRHIAQGDTVNCWTRQYQHSRTSNRLLATGMGSAPVEYYPDTPTLEYRYGYNAHGSMTNMPHLPAMDWDFTEHLGHIARTAGTQGSDPDGCPDASLEAWYCYDATKERTRKRVVKQGGIVEERIYLGGFEIYRKYNGSSTEPKLERETLHIMDDKQRIALVETKTIDTNVPASALPETLTRYQLGNHLGSASLELDEEAQVISYEEYHPYGTTAHQAVNKDIRATAKRYRYTGKERDEESGLYYHGARYYAPWLGRWISRDPAGLVDGPHLYSYVKENPIHYSDPTGEVIFSEMLDELASVPGKLWNEVKEYVSGDLQEIKEMLGLAQPASLEMTPLPDVKPKKPELKEYVPPTEAELEQKAENQSLRPPTVRVPQEGGGRKELKVFESAEDRQNRQSRIEKAQAKQFGKAAAREVVSGAVVIGATVVASEFVAEIGPSILRTAITDAASVRPISPAGSPLISDEAMARLATVNRNIEDQLVTLTTGKDDFAHLAIKLRPGEQTYLTHAKPGYIQIAGETHPISDLVPTMRASPYPVQRIYGCNLAGSEAAIAELDAAALAADKTIITYDMPVSINKAGEVVMDLEHLGLPSTELAREFVFRPWWQKP